MGSYLLRVGLAFLGVVAFVALGAVLESGTGLPFDTTYRVACAVACLVFIFKLGSDHSGERWPQTGFWGALLVNISLFFTPLVDRPASRGEIMLFALPDAVVVLVALISSYRVSDVHQRAVRQQMILALVVAVVCCALLLGGLLVEQSSAR